MPTTTDLSIQTTRKARAAEVIELMIRGSSKKAALEKVGMDPRTYADIISEYPELLGNLEQLYMDRLTGLVEEIIEDRANNLRSIMKFTKTLRYRMELNILDESAARMLAKLDAHMQDRFLAPIFERKPVQEPVPGPTNTDDQKAASAILANMGTRTMKVRRVTEEVTIEPEEPVIDAKFDIEPTKSS